MALSAEGEVWRSLELIFAGCLYRAVPREPWLARTAPSPHHESDDGHLVDDGLGGEVYDAQQAWGEERVSAGCGCPVASCSQPLWLPQPPLWVTPCPPPRSSPSPLTYQEAPNFVGPPLDAHHEHAGDSQGGEAVPLHQALAGPACGEEKRHLMDDQTGQVSHPQENPRQLEVLFLFAEPPGQCSSAPQDLQQQSVHV